MNREEFIATLNRWYDETGVDFNDCHVSHGGSMIMLGLRESTDDIDLTVTRDVWDQFVADGFKITHLPANGKCAAVDLISVTDKIDIHLENEWVTHDLYCLRGIWYRSAIETLADKLLLGREKDLKDIPVLQEYINNDY